MKLSDLTNRYHFDESTIEKIIYTARKKEVILEITFCVWAQDWYDESRDNELEKLILTFKNVSKTNCKNYSAGTEDLIKECALIVDDNGNEAIKFTNFFEKGSYTITIFADEVDAKYRDGESWNYHYDMKY